ncbi:MAG: GNAT family N-acetyltransferase [Geminicoccaceae bacterium]
MSLTIRRARTGEGPALSALCVRSKAVWGYDEAFLAYTVDPLMVHEPAIATGHVLVAAEGQRLIGVAELGMRRFSSVGGLDKLFVAPDRLRRGVGTALFQAVAALAVRRGLQRLRLLSDPHAAGFYEGLGAVRLGEAPSGPIPGRLLPVYELRVRGRRWPQRTGTGGRLA